MKNKFILISARFIFPFVLLLFNSHSFVYGQWSLKTGSARDISVGANGSVWIVGTNPVSGGYGVYKWNGTGWTGIDGGGVRIAVDPVGNPWLLNDAGRIFRRNGDKWIQLPGAAKDIGIGKDGSVWVIGMLEVNGGFSVHKWNGVYWDKIDGGGIRIAVDPDGNPWIINNAGQIFRHAGNNWIQLPGAAKDIGIGKDGSVWVIGMLAVNGGYSVHKWNGAYWEQIDGGATDISVAPNGKPWVINEYNQIFERQ
jgi:hypothetical protein